MRLTRISSLIGRLLASGLARKLSHGDSSRPLVSFTFDDFPRSAFGTAGSMLTLRGVRGTYYAAVGLMDKTTHLGEMFTASDLRDVAQSGHEVACHTFDHVPSRSISQRELLAQCDYNREAMKTILGAYRPRSFSYPFGDVSLAAKRALAESFETCRGITAGVNRSPIDLAYLRANPLYSGGRNDRLLKHLRSAILCNGWIILYTHDVRPNPSPFGCTPSDFRDVLSFVLDSGAEVVTVADGARRFMP